MRFSGTSTLLLDEVGDVGVAWWRWFGSAKGPLLGVGAVCGAVSREACSGGEEVSGCVFVDFGWSGEGTLTAEGVEPIASAVVAKCGWSWGRL